MAETFKSRTWNAVAGAYEETETERPAVEEVCDAVQPFTANLWERQRVGYIRSLKIAGTDLPADLRLYDPTDLKKAAESYKPVTGVVEKIVWGGGPLDPLTFEFLVTAKNWQKAANVEYREEDGEEDQEYEVAEIDFVVYSFDLVAQKFYRSFYSRSAKIKGHFRFTESDYFVQQDLTEEEQKRNPVVYHVKISILPPAGTAQTLFLAFGDGQWIAKPWGDASAEAKAKAVKDAAERLSRREQAKLDAEKAKREEEDERRLQDEIEEQESYASTIARDEEKKRAEELAKIREETAAKAAVLRGAADEARALAERAEQLADARAKLEAEVSIAQTELDQASLDLEQFDRGARAETDALGRELERTVAEYRRRKGEDEEETPERTRAKGLEGLKTEADVQAEITKVGKLKKEADEAARVEENKRKALLDRKKRASPREIEAEREERAREKKAEEKKLKENPPKPPKTKAQKAAAEAKIKRHAAALEARQAEREAERKQHERSRPPPKKTAPRREDGDAEGPGAKKQAPPAKLPPSVPAEETDPFEVKAIELAEKVAVWREASEKHEARLALLRTRLFELELARAQRSSETARQEAQSVAEEDEALAAIEEENAARASEMRARLDQERASLRTRLERVEKRAQEARRALAVYMGLEEDPEESLGLEALGIEVAEGEERPRIPTDAEVVRARLAQEAAEQEAEYGPGVAAALDAAEQARLLSDEARRESVEQRRRLQRQRAEIVKLERRLAHIRQRAEHASGALAAHDFREMLSVKLKLTLGAETKEVPGGSVASFSIDLHTWGFTGEVEVVVSLEAGDDPLLTGFTGTKPIEVEIAVKSAFQPEKNPPDALVLKGIVRDRSVIEESSDELADVTLLHRRYRMSFADAASVLWKQHVPCELFTDMALKDVVDLQKGGKVTITGDWAGHWDAAKPIIFLGLGAEKSRASFYDFMIWYAARNNGNFIYDAKTNAYALLGAKPAGAKAVSIDPDDVDDMRIVLAAVPRYTKSVLNAWSEATTRKAAVPNPAAVTGVRQDPLVRTWIGQQFEDEAKIEGARLVARKSEVHLTFGRFPTVTFSTGSIVDWKHQGWATAIYNKAGSYRVRSFSIAARSAAAPESSSAGGAFGDFLVRAGAVLEERLETAPHLPPYEPPRYPAFVEGKIVAVGGEDADRMWLVVDDKKTSISYYKVDIPLWNKKIPALFHPGPLHGHFYFPAYKNERVLIALGLFDAEIARFIEWAPKGRVPMDTQGNHLLLGKSDKNETSISHLYVDEKPELKIFREKAGDTQTWTLKEGALEILVKADDAAVEATPKFDVTMQVESAKGDLQMQGGGAVAEVNGELAGQLAGPTGALTGAQGEVEGELGAMESELAGDAAGVRGELEGKLAGLGKGSAALDAALASAIADIDKAMA